MKFCCQNFPSKKDGRFISFYDTRTEETIIEYYPPHREYMTVHGKDIGCYIQYCPWCGTKLPKELSDEWYDILEKEYNITDPIGEERSKVPAEFWTGEWWKKRGL
nr:hypothetical protein [Rickettsia endosymbiont of Ceutorhynchus assimilis]